MPIKKPASNVVVAKPVSLVRARRSGAPRLARSSTSWRQHLEPDLVKVVIGGDHRRQPQLPHDCDARAVGERQVLVAILEEEVSRPFETIVVNPLPPQPSAPIDLMPPRARGSETQAISNQRQRLIDDEVSRDQGSAGLENRVTSRGAGRMCRMGPICAGHPTAGIDEHGVQWGYKIAS